MCIQKKFLHAARNRWTIFRKFSDKEKKISRIRFSKKTTVLFKSNADTCLQNLPKFLAFLQILDHYKILTTFLLIFEAHTVLTGLNFWWDIPRGYSCDSELIEQKFILLCEFCYQNPSYCLVFSKRFGWICGLYLCNVQEKTAEISSMDWIMPSMSLHSTFPYVCVFVIES